MVGLANCPAAEEQPVEKAPAKKAVESPIKYLPLDAPAGMSQAVIVERMPLVHTRQLFAFDREGKLVSGRLA